MPEYGYYLIIALVLLIIASAFFSGSEIVYAKVNKVKLKKEANSGKKADKLALKLVDNYPTMLSTILVGNNLVNIASSSIGTILFVSIFGKENGPSISILILTIVILIFGEVLPKTIFSRYNYTLSKIFAPIIVFFSIVFKFIVPRKTLYTSKNYLYRYLLS